MKRLLSAFLSIVMMMSIVYEVDFSSYASDNVISVGEYITLGNYYGQPIKWRCIGIDENGPLMLSDKILCLKAFDAKGDNDEYHKDGWGYIRKERGSNCWSDSSLRQWLNSTSSIVEYSHCPPNVNNLYEGYNAYDEEAGFLNAFSMDDLSAIKTVTQRCYINSWELNRDGYYDGGDKELIYSVINTSDQKTDYSGYYYQNVTDKIFLLGPEQIDLGSKNLGTSYILNSYPTEKAVENSDYKNDSLSSNKYWDFWLGIPRNEGASYENQTLASTLNGGATGLYYAGCYTGYYGVRPAFYLNTEGSIYMDGIPKLTEESALNFLCFLYNDDVTKTDIANTTAYKIFTGTFNGTPDEYKATAISVSIFIRTRLNSLISESEFNLSDSQTILMDYLNEKLKESKDLPQEIIDEYMGKAKKVLTEGIADFLVGIIADFNGVIITDDMLDWSTVGFDAVENISDLANKVADFLEYSAATIQGCRFVLASENLGRYNYFSSYLLNRGNYSSNEDYIFKVLDDSNFEICSLNTTGGLAIDSISWITGKNSWTNHRSEIQEWAEFTYQLESYSQKSICEYKSEIIEPTCINEGYTLYTCVYCGDSYKEDITTPLGHDYYSEKISPTCTSQGYTKYTCKRCNYSYDGEYTDSLGGHTYVHVKTIAPTCTAQGYDLYTCSVCSATEKRNYVNALGHKYEFTKTITPTCSAQGYDLYTCSVCEATEKRNYVAVIEHKYEFTKTIKPTCTQQGYDLYTCSACGTTEERNYVNAKGHVNTLTNTVLSTCNTEGYNEFICSVCGNITKETIRKLDGSVLSGVLKNAEEKLENNNFSTENYENLKAVYDKHKNALDTYTSQLEVDNAVTEINTAINIAVSETAIGDTMSGSTEDGLTWSWSRDTGELVLTGEGAMDGYDSDTMPWYDVLPYTTSIVIKEGITSIGSYAFYNATNVTGILLPSTLTNLDERAFEYCTSVEELVVPDSVTNIGYGSFGNLINLKKVSVPATATYRSYGFYNANAVEEITITPGVDGVIPNSNVTDEQSYFLDMLFRKTGNFGPWKYADNAVIIISDGVTNIGDKTFYNCDGILKINLPNTITQIGNDVFFNCDSLTDIYYSGSEIQWGSISVGANNDSLVNATIHYNWIELDTDALTAALEMFDNLDSADYSTQSYSNLSSVVEEYRGVIETAQTQQEIDDAVTAILEAMYDLIPYFNLNLSAENGNYEVQYDSTTSSESKYSLLFGTEVTLTAIANEGYDFAGWYDETSGVYLSKESTYTFKITANTNIKAVFVEEQSATLIFTTYSNWVKDEITKTVDEWNEMTSIEDLLPDVPYRYGYSNGRWVYDNDKVLAKLRAGENVSIVAEYDADDTSLPTSPTPSGNIPVLDLYYKLDADENIGSFVMATGIPENCQIESVGMAFYYKNANQFNPENFELLLNNKMLTSTFELDDSNIYIANIDRFTSKNNWSVRGYITYYDADGNLKTVYSNQINIVGREQV